MRKAFAKSTACVALQASLFAAIVAAQFHGAALGQDTDAESGPTPLTTETLGMTGWRHDPITITTQALGMTGWRPDPVVAITTRALGMTGWRRDPIIITTRALSMTGWQRDPMIVTTEGLGMAGWGHDPIAITAQALGMTGWGNVPEECSAPFVRDNTGEGCACPAGLLPSGDGCVAAGASPPADLRVEIEGPDVCESGKICPFDILVTNVGAGPFHGALVVRDEINLAYAQVSAADGGWSCTVDTCFYPGVTLAPGENETLTLDVLVPASTRRGVQLLNCAELKMPEPGDTPVRFVQLMLAVAGIDVGPADNQMGKKTRGGIEEFRRTVGLPSSAGIDEPLIAALRGLMPLDPHPENDRDCAGSRIVR